MKYSPSFISSPSQGVQCTARSEDWISAAGVSLCAGTLFLFRSSLSSLAAQTPSVSRGLNRQRCGCR